MIYKITLKIKDDIDELLNILDKYSIDYEVNEVYED